MYTCPYIKDSRVVPAGTSSSYSFPSGHTMYVTSMYGTIGLWQWKERKWLAWVCFTLIFTTGFARNYLGMHTPRM